MLDFVASVMINDSRVCTSSNELYLRLHRDSREQDDSSVCYDETWPIIQGINLTSIQRIEWSLQTGKINLKPRKTTSVIETLIITRDSVKGNKLHFLFRQFCRCGFEFIFTEYTQQWMSLVNLLSLNFLVAIFDSKHYSKVQQTFKKFSNSRVTESINI